MVISRIEIKFRPSDVMKPPQMASKENTKPIWLDDWLQTRIFEDGRQCREHEYQYETICCCVCMGKTLCPTCWKNSTEHKDHEFIRVTTCSNRTAVHVLCIEKFWDVSQIQDYIINYKKVVFLNSDKGSTQQQSNGKPSCETCSRKLIGSKFKFCSIACKKQMIESEPVVLKRLPSLKPERRIRKGVPRRAPLF